MAPKLGICEHTVQAIESLRLIFVARDIIYAGLRNQEETEWLISKESKANNSEMTIRQGRKKLQKRVSALIF